MRPADIGGSYGSSQKLTTTSNTATRQFAQVLDTAKSASGTGSPETAKGGTDAAKDLLNARNPYFYNPLLHKMDPSYDPEQAKAQSFATTLHDYEQKGDTADIAGLLNTLGPAQAAQLFAEAGNLQGQQVTGNGTVFAKNHTELDQVLGKALLAPSVQLGDGTRPGTLAANLLQHATQSGNDALSIAGILDQSGPSTQVEALKHQFLDRVLVDGKALGIATTDSVDHTAYAQAALVVVNGDPTRFAQYRNMLGAQDAAATVAAINNPSRVQGLAAYDRATQYLDQLNQKMKAGGKLTDSEYSYLWDYYNTLGPSLPKLDQWLNDPATLTAEMTADHLPAMMPDLQQVAAAALHARGTIVADGLLNLSRAAEQKADSGAPPYKYGPGGEQMGRGGVGGLPPSITHDLYMDLGRATWDPKTRSWVGANEGNATGFSDLLTSYSSAGVTGGAGFSQAMGEAGIRWKQERNAIHGTRQRQIDDWVDHHSDASGGFLGFGQTSAADHVRAALDGQVTELGLLSADEQRYLIDKVLDRWTVGKGDGPGGAAELAQSLSDNQQLSDMFAERLSAKAASLMQRPAGNGSIDDPHTQARAYALDAIEAVSGDLEKTPSDYSRLRQMLNDLGPADAAELMQVLNPMAPGNNYYQMAQTQDRVLTAMNGGPHTQVTSAIVQNIFAETTPAEVHAIASLQTNLAAALSREWNPDDPAKQASEQNRLAGILGTDQGQLLLFGSSNDGKVPLDAHVNALAIIRSDPSINAATLKQTGDPWSNPAILGPMARANAQQYFNLRGDQPQRLEGTDLDNTVGYAMGFAPAVPRDASTAQAQAAQGKFSYYGQGPGQKPVQAVLDQIRRLGGSAPQVTVLPIEYGSSDFGPVQLPLFRVETASGEKYVDNTGRAYSSFEDWKSNNQLPPGTVFYPDQGHLTAGPHGAVKLASSDTPSTPDTTWKKVKGALNDLALVGGIIAGGALIIGTDGVATPIVSGIAVASGAWGAYSSGSELLDRAQHGQSINPLQDSSARGLWLSLAANTAGMGAFASEAALGRLASSEGTLSSAAAWTVGTAKAVSNATNAAAFANAGIDLAANWDAMTPAQRAQSVLSMGFWGVTIAVGTKEARGPGDMFNPAAMTRALSDAYQPPVTRTTALPGNRVEIISDPQTGRPAILAGEQASGAEIQLHVNVARMMARDQALQGQIKALLGASPEPGTLAYSIKYENIKLNQKIADLQSGLNDPNLTPQQRSQIQGDIDTTNAYLDQQLQSLASIAHSPSLAGIAAPGDGRARAEELPGLVEALENGPYAHQGYYFRPQNDPDAAPLIVGSKGYDSEHRQLVAYQKDDGTWGIKEAPGPNLPTFTPIVDDLSSSLTLPKGLTGEQQTELKADLAARQKAVTARDAATDPATRNAEGYKVTVQSNLIGEIGARAYVQSEFPNAEPIYGGDGSRPGDFDQVYRQTLPDGKVRLLVVEAKGGNSPLGTKIVNGQVETQGTPEYFASTARSMSNMKGNVQAQSVGEELISAYDEGRTLDGGRAEVVYLVVRTPISTQGSTSHAGPVSAKQFDLTH